MTLTSTICVSVNSRTYDSTFYGCSADVRDSLPSLDANFRGFKNKHPLRRYLIDSSWYQSLYRWKGGSYQRISRGDSLLNEVVLVGLYFLDRAPRRRRSAIQLAARNQNSLRRERDWAPPKQSAFIGGLKEYMMPLPGCYSSQLQESTTGIEGCDF
jgi:hypothetical protein